MKKFCCSIFLFCVMMAPAPIHASEKPAESLKAAFVRNDDLWIKIGNQEKRITTGEFVRLPKWSFDGHWLAYLKGEKREEIPLYEGELWLYNLKKNKHFKIYSNSNRNFLWAPNKDIIAFQTKDSLNMVNVSSINYVYHIGSRIENFSWLPDGKGFLTSAKHAKKLHSNIIISKILLNQLASNTRSSLLSCVAVDKDEYYTTTSQFKYSSDGKWIAFLLIPTASISADSNTLCLLSADGKTFKKIDKMLNYEEWFKWEQSHSLLGSISGEAREAITNKRLKISEPFDCKSKALTPGGYVDRDFTWIDKETLITARSIKSDWVDVPYRLMPALYSTHLKTNIQLKITNPPEKFGDFYPQTIDGKIIWIRTNRQKADVMTGERDGTNQIQWISNLNTGSGYYEKWEWDEVFCLYVH